jgi:hypothetical protein
MSANPRVLEEALQQVGTRQSKGSLPTAPAPIPGPSEPVADGAAPHAADNGRDARGRFGKGNRFSCGNPFARRLAKMREAALAAVSETELTELFKALYRKALAGDAACAKVLLLYLIGKPAAAVDPDALDAQEWQQLEAAPTAARLFRVLSDCVSPDDACEEVRTHGAADLIARLTHALVQARFAEQLQAEREARYGR